MTTVAFLGVIVPVTAVILGVVFRHEAFNTGSLAGGAVVLVGVALAIRSDARARGESKESYLGVEGIVAASAEPELVGCGTQPLAESACPSAEA
jgi:hypothetical protein